MVYAIFKYPNNGFEADVKRAKDRGLVVEEQYKVEEVDVGSWITYIKLQDFPGVFNSVQFEFRDENGKKIDITR